ncbi:hypothetical protein EXIGLDRAFT_719693 [Exidia glandulosa HHB12029]|uniref:GID complex catalytic subunit 2 n=1 Tax=Exidia glandulosa HHB12029 TaxID=1314781 RepID=A0A165GV92_EXIGL|nr:hypothetical protein EXIGLDRAFT_719693 [Exidia glandulosa HHB12029]
MSAELLKELAKVEKVMAYDAAPSARPSSSKKAPSQSIGSSLDSLLDSLREFKQGIEAGATSAEVVGLIARTVDEKKKEIDDRQKEVYNALGKLGKALDKKFPNALPEWQPVFTSPTSAAALDRTVALHLVRTGQFSTAATFVEESGVKLPDDFKTKFLSMHAILDALRRQDLAPALEWAAANRPFLEARGSRLEFCLHRSQYMRILFSSNPPNPVLGINYCKNFCQHLISAHEHEFQRLLTCTIFLPEERMRTSPYADLTDPSIHTELEGMLTQEFCAKLGMSKQLPLRVVGDIGAGGALSRIEKGRKVMRERKSEWSLSDELPIDIPLPPENRYHSIFACPVSKEQSTPSNPPMMMSCGHVVSKESLTKLTKPGGRVKCPYCPQESKESAALQVHF